MLHSVSSTDLNEINIRSSFYFHSAYFPWFDRGERKRQKRLHRHHLV